MRRRFRTVAATHGVALHVTIDRIRLTYDGRICFNIQNQTTD
jgi:hypothetical protein